MASRFFHFARQSTSRLAGRVSKPLSYGSGLLATTMFWGSDSLKSERKAYESAASAQFFTAAHNPLPCGWTGPVFVPNFNYPQKADSSAWLDKKTHPWLEINFKTHPEQYLNAVLDYCFEGNIKPEIERSFNMAGSKRWFHAPWQHASPVGREPIHGCTQELPTPEGWLSSGQNRQVQTLAIGYYNEPGGYLFGQVWKDNSEPNYKGPNGKGVAFPEGTVTFKLLFTQCTPQEAPYLEGAPTWQAMVQSYNGSPADPDPPRVVGDVRLLQIDVAVSDRRFDSPTGWNFGSFTYDSSVKHSNPWKRLIPVGLQWGNDPNRTLAEKDEKLQEGWVNEVAKKRIITHARPMVGLDNRLAGPADTFMSSCSACHMTAQYPSIGSLVVNSPKPPATPLTQDIGNSERSYYFRNMFCGSIFDQNMNFYAPTAPQDVFSLDYSLQMQGGLNNFSVWRKAAFPNVATQHAATLEKAVPGTKLLPNHKFEARFLAGDIPANHTTRPHM